ESAFWSSRNLFQSVQMTGFAPVVPAGSSAMPEPLGNLSGICFESFASVAALSAALAASALPSRKALTPPIAAPCDFMNSRRSFATEAASCAETTAAPMPQANAPAAMRPPIRMLTFILSSPSKLPWAPLPADAPGRAASGDRLHDVRLEPGSGAETLVPCPDVRQFAALDGEIEPSVGEDAETNIREREGAGGEFLALEA